MKPQDKENDHAYIIEFKVHKPGKEKDLEQTLTNAHIQIQEKQYAAGLIAEGFAPERIRKYGIVFMGKECLIGWGWHPQKKNPLSSRINSREQIFKCRGYGLKQAGR